MNAVEINPRVCNGKPVITGTRIPVTVILDNLGAGLSVDEVLERFPELRREQVLGAIGYCHKMIEHTELEPAGR